ncbi:ABC transporter ATP-binding protein [Stigmatella sp. ncwal1]|uniref:ABC transporter ATP-binding protein n=1 Tax=Stigmatella ashevillensis TaxID=2995309 RepID=A0ABT5DHR4_9BACT|nr:ABC transporter ATP-binding protein [Stigmatella ashevillena]MDC0713197.1 ABC transporter ATP-binding protein [Stigmatella ashevillena]
MSLLSILERHRLLDGEALAQIHRLQRDKGYLVEEALKELGAEHAEAAASASALLERERRQRLNLKGLRRVFSELSRHRGARGLLLLLSAGSAVFSFPFAFAWYLGTVLQHLRYNHDTSSLWVLTAVAATVLVTGTLLEFLLNTWAAQCNFHITQGLVMRCWERLLHMPYALYRRQEQGRLLSNLTDVIEVLQKHQLYTLRNLLRSLCLIGVSTVALLSFHFAFVLIVVPAVVLTCGVPILISDRATSSLRNEPQAMGRISGFLKSAFASHWLLRFKGGEAVERRLAHIAAGHFINQSRKWLTWNLAYNSRVTLTLLSFLSVLWIGGSLYFAGTIRLGELVTAYLLVTMVTPKLDDVYRIYVYGQSMQANYEILDELMSAPVQSTPRPREDPAPRITSVRLDRVSFRYRPGEPDVLKEASFELRRGYHYAIQGESGSGKSTLVDVLLGLLHPDAGRLLVNGHPLTPEDLPGYWSRVALHDQGNFVFRDRSATDNATPTTGNTGPAEDWHRLANQLGLPQWGHKRPSELSGGERQRICLLRTLATRADIYVFDEPTSALDSANARLVMDSILALRNAIVLVISHSPEAVKRFEHVIRVEQGHVTLRGAALEHEREPAA